MRSLPPERVVQLVYFAQFLELQSTRQEKGADLPDGSGDEKWDQLLAQPDTRQLLQEMAREAYEDYLAERTSDIAITEDGRLAPA